ncbi:MAG: hypothetical protein JJV89_01045 [Desulfosarcina sp.]|nr:hypothetical protein [Desulfobacterales bacterium]
MLTSFNNKKQIFIGGWILGAVLLLLYNGFEINNFDKPQASREMEKLLQIKLKWEDFSKNQDSIKKNKPDQIDYDRLLPKFTKKKKSPHNPAVIAQEAPKELVKKIEPILPTLAGIVKNFDIDGKISLFAMLDGMVLSEHEAINEFKVEKITEQGITLKKGEKSWYIQMPEVIFSLGSQTKQ